MYLLGIYPSVVVHYRVRMPPQQSWISRWFGVLGSPIEGKVLIGPNWFASVMGTAIVASAGATLPVAVPQFITTAAWTISVVLLLALLVFMPLNWVQHPDNLRNLADDPIAIQFFGAPPMALMAVAAATLLVGQQYIGEGLAVGIAWVLWSVGTALGFVTAVAVPFRLFTALEVRHDGAFGGWLMPVVPSISAASITSSGMDSRAA